MRYSLVVGCLISCTSRGSLELDLDLPADPDLRPTGMATITIHATGPTLTPVVTTEPLDDNNAFSGPTLPAAQDVQIDLALRDASGRLVGVGQAPHTVNLVDGEQAQLSVPVRRPFVYATSGQSVYTFDPTLDQRDLKFQGQLQGLVEPRVVTSLGGERLVIAGTSQLELVDTATHQLAGPPISISGPVSDVAAVPGTNLLAVAHPDGIAIVRLDTGDVTNAGVGPVDRVTIARGVDGRMYAVGLVDRVAPLETPLATCGGASSIVAVSIDAPVAVNPVSLGVAVSALAADPAQPSIFLALPCAGQIARIDGDFTSGATPMPSIKAQLPNAAVVAVVGERLWAAGTKPSTPVCSQGSCTSTSSLSCPETTTNRVSYVAMGAQIVIQSMPVDGDAAVTIELPARDEKMVSLDDAAGAHSQVLHPLGAVPVDFVVLPGGQYVSLVTRSSFFIESLIDATAGVVLPCLKATTGDWMLVDSTSATVTERVRSKCDLIFRTGAFFANWQCGDPPPSEKPTQGDFMPLSVGALLGARD